MLNPLSAPLRLIESTISTLSSYLDTPTIDYRSFVILATWAQTAFEVYIDRRQIPCFSRPSPPIELKEHLPQETYVKAQKYGLDKLRFGMIKAVWNQMLGWGMIKTGLYSVSWGWSARVMRYAGLGSDRVVSSQVLRAAVPALLPVITGSRTTIPHISHHHDNYPPN
jgi:STE24 endopeptidase